MKRNFCLLFSFLSFLQLSVSQNYLWENQWLNNQNQKRNEDQHWNANNIFSPNFPPGGSYSGDPDPYSGTNNILIKLWSAKTKSIEIPVALSYVATGIRVQQLASSVGLGWSLNPGGSINRSVRGLPDDVWDQSGSPESLGWLYSRYLHEHDKVCQHIGNFDITDTLHWGNLYTILGGDNLGCKNDPEPDLYYFDSPFISGCFVFSNIIKPPDSLPVIRFLNQSDLKVKVTYTDTAAMGDHSILGFIVTDGNGNKYYFDKMERISIHSYHNAQQNAPQYLQNNAFYSAPYSIKTELESEYTSRWFLTKIETYLDETISFYYTTEKYMSDPLEGDYSRGNENQTIDVYKKHLSNILQGNTGPDDNDHVSTWRLTQIDGPTFRVDFLANNARQDMLDFFYDKPKRVDQIIVYSKIDTGTSAIYPIRNFDFEYYYMTPATNGNSNNTIYYFQNQKADTRLMLRSVRESFGTKTYPPYVFEYKSESSPLPNRLSYNVDLFGFYNGEMGASNQTFIPPVHINANENGNERFSALALSGYSQYGDGAIRNTDTNALKIGVLEKIHYPSGSYTKYIYQPHHFYYKGEQIVGGGLRLASSLTYPGETSNEPLVTTYSYSNGKVLEIPKFGYYDPTFTYASMPYPPPPFEDYLFRCYVRTSANLAQTNLSVGYDKVTVTQTNGGKTEYYFENSPSAGDTTSLVFSPYEVPDAYLYRLNQSATITGFDLDLTEHSTYPFAPAVNVDWFRGRMNAIKEYSASGNVTSRRYYQYSQRYKNNDSLSHPDEDVVYGLCVGFLENGSGLHGPIAAASKYKIFTGVVNLPESIVISTVNESGDSLTVRNEFIYNKYNQVSSTIYKDLSDGSQRTTWSKYVLDYFDVKDTTLQHNLSITDPHSNAIYRMAESNVVYPKIEDAYGIIYPGNSNPVYITTCQLTTYRNIGLSTNYKYLPDQFYQLMTNAPISTAVSNNQRFTMSFIDPNDTSFVKDSRYKLSSTCDFYDDKFRLVDFHKDNDVMFTTIWDSFNDKIIGSSSNANHYEVDYSGFEFKRFNGWEHDTGVDIIWFTNGAQAGTNVHSGICSVETGGWSNKIWKSFPITNPMNHQGFEGSVWVKGSTNLTLKLQAKNDTQVVLERTISNTGSNSEWHLLKIQIMRSEISGNDCDNFYFEIGGYGYIDDVKFMPVDALLSTSSYDNSMNLLSESDPNDIYSHYEYDDLGRLTRSRDDEWNILSTYEYNFGNPALFNVIEDSSIPYPDGIINTNEPLVVVANTSGTDSKFSLEITPPDSNHHYTYNNNSPLTNNVTGNFSHLQFQNSGDYNLKVTFFNGGETGISYERIIHVY
jgi:YD repeat-containing protein